MKYKAASAVIVAAALAASLFIPQTQALAESALSVFRVNDARIITITLSDIQDMADAVDLPGLLEKARSLYENAAGGAVGSGAGAEAGRVIGVACDAAVNGALGGNVQNPPDATDNADKLNKLKTDGPQAFRGAHMFKRISSPREFTYFNFSLPRELAGQSAELYASEPVTQTVIVDAAKVNRALAEIGAPAIDGGLGGQKIDITAPPAVMAKYDDVALFAAQEPYASGDAAKAIWAALTAWDAIPPDLRAQLAAVDITQQDVYLPVIQGIAREADIGGATGYIYSARDFAQFSSILPGAPETDEAFSGLRQSNSAALIWTRGGVVYTLVGDKTDSELIRIAGSVR